MAELESKYDLDVTGYLNALDQVDARLGTHIDHFKALAKLDPFKEAAQSAGNYDRELSDGVKAYAKQEQAAKELKEELAKIHAEQAKVAKGQKELLAAAKYDKLKGELEGVKKKLESVSKELTSIKQKNKETSDSFGSLGKVVGTAQRALQGFLALAAVQQIFSIGKAVFDTTAKFEKYEKILQTALGSQKLATQSMEALKTIAAQTAFSMDELTSGYVKMVNRGLRPSSQEIIKLTDLAASQGKSFDQLVEAVLDAQTGEFERLKEFGIKAKKEAGEVSLAFKGQTESVKASERAIFDAIVAMGAINGVAGQNAELMSTLDGKTSSLGDSIDALSTKLGTVFMPIFNTVLSGLSKGVDLLGSAADAVGRWTGLISESEVALGSLNDQQRATADAEKRLIPLIERYDELKGKTTLNKKEQDELRKVIDEIQKAVPKAASAFDIYGKALDINRDKVIEFLDQNQNMTKEMKQLAKERIGEELTTMSNKQRQLVRELSQGFVEVYEQGVRSERKLTNEQIVQRQVALNEIKKKTIELRRALRGIDSGATQSSNELPTGGETISNETPVDPKLLAAMEKYKDEKLKLEQTYGRERLETLKENEEQYILEKAKFAKKQIELERAAYLAIKRAALGGKASLSADESKKFDDRINFVGAVSQKELDAYYQSVNATEKQVNSMLSDEYQQRVQQIEEMYSKIIKEAQDKGVSQARIEQLKNKKILEQDKVFEEQKRARAERIANANILSAGIGVVDAELTGQKSLIFQARMQENNVQQQEAQKRLEYLQSKENPTVVEQEQILELIKTLKELQLARKGLEKDENDRKKNQSAISKLLEELGVKDDDMAAALEGVQTFTSAVQSAMSELYSALNEMSARRVAQIDKEIDKKQEQVDVEKELNEQGLANNLGARVKELETLKTLRQQALEDQKRIQKQQFLIDTATQISSMTTAASKVFAGFSSIPVVGVGLGIAAVALMLGAFAAAKIKSFQLINQQQPDQYEFGGMVGGKRHRDGGTIIEAEKGEFVTNRKSTAKYLDLIDAINQDDQNRILDYLVKDLLSNTGVIVSEPERIETMRFLQEYNHDMRQAEDHNLAELKAIRQELREIKEGTNKIPDEQLVNVGEGKYARVKKNSTVVFELPKEK